MKEFIENEAFGHDASCMCPIGADIDPNPVVDSRFRVRGVDKLRVVNTSASPAISRSSIAVPVYMLSEMATDVILQDNFRLTHNVLLSPDLPTWATITSTYL